MSKSNVRNYTNDEILARVKSLPSFQALPSNYWIVGVRSNEDAPNKYDDKFYIFAGDKFITLLHGTTHPGVPILQGGFIKYNKVGAAVIKSNEWYYGVWRYGMHLKRMPALLQIGKFLGYRDGDRDKKAEEIGPVQTFHWTGINFHTVSFDSKSTYVPEDINGWSAGCQVVPDVQKFNQTINKFFKDQKSVTYCLLQEWND